MREHKLVQLTDEANRELVVYLVAHAKHRAADAGGQVNGQARDDRRGTALRGLRVRLEVVACRNAVPFAVTSAEVRWHRGRPAGGQDYQLDALGGGLQHVN